MTRDIKGIQMLCKLTFFLCFVLAFTGNATTADAPIVTTIAGGVNGKTGWEASGFSGDGGPASESTVDQPYGLSVDNDGNLFIADQQNHRIRKIDKDGNISTIAGIGLVGFDDFAGDDGPAVDARLFGATDVFAHSSGEIYIADWGNNRIRKIDTSGVIRTVAGGGTNPPSDGGSALEAFFTPYCVAVDDDGTMYIGTYPVYDDDAPYHQILRVDTKGSITVFAGTASGTAGFSGDGGPATEAQLNEPKDVAIGPDGSIYIADLMNHRVRKVDTDGVITTFAGSGDAGKTKWGTNYSGDGGPATEAELDEVRALAVSDKGTVYIADSDNHCVRAVGTDGVISTVAGGVLNDYGSTTSGFSGDGGAATAALFGQPYGLALDSSGNLYISTDNERIRMVAGVESTSVGDGDDGEGDDGDDDADSDDSADPFAGDAPIVQTIAGGVNGLTTWEAYGFEGDGGPASESALDEPYGLSFDSDGNLFIADNTNHRIRRIDTDGNISTVAGIGEVSEGSFGGDDGPATEAILNYPTDVFAHHSGDIYIADQGNGRIRKIDTSGGISTVAGGGKNRPSDGGSALDLSIAPYCVAVDTDGTMYIGTFPYSYEDPEYHQIVRVDSDGSVSVFAGAGTAGFDGDGGPATEALLNEPKDVVIGPGGSVYIADYLNHRVRVVDSNGTITTFAGSGETGDYKSGNHFSGDNGPATEAVLNGVRALAVSDAGNVYIGESSNYCVRGVQDGYIMTAAGGVINEAGETYEGFSGDGGSSIEAVFGSIYGLALDSTGSLYISTGNQRIRMVEGIEYFANEGDDDDSDSGDDGEGEDEGGDGDTVALPSGEVGPMGLDLDPTFGDQGLRQTPENPVSGDKIEVEIFVTEGANGEGGFLAELTWDVQELSYSAFSTQDVFSGAMTLETAGDGKMTLSNVILGGLASKDSGSAGVATFEVVETFSGEAQITLYSGKLGPNDVTIGPGAAYVVIGGNKDVSLTPQQASDFDGDGIVGFGDFLQFASGFGGVEGDSRYDSRLDLDKDGFVGFSDFLSFAAVFGQLVE